MFDNPDFIKKLLVKDGKGKSTDETSDSMDKFRLDRCSWYDDVYRLNVCRQILKKSD